MSGRWRARASQGVQAMVAVAGVVALGVCFAQPSSAELDGTCPMHGISAVPAAEIEQVESANATLIQLVDAYQQAPDPASLEQLQDAARRRRMLLEAVLQKNPSEFLRLTLSADELANAPLEIQQDLESPVTLTGTREVDMNMYFEESKMEMFYYLLVGDQRYTLRPVESPENPHTGDVVKVSGVQLGEQIAVPAMTQAQAPAMQTLSVAPLGQPRGKEKVLLLYVNFEDDRREPYTIADANAILKQANDWDREASYGAYETEWQVVGWKRLPMSIGSSCSETEIFDQAIEAADDDVDFTTVNRIVLVFPTSGCFSWSGRVVAFGKSSFVTRDGRVSAGIEWVNKNFGVHVITHELAHTFGLYHANYADCGSATIGTDAKLSACNNREYGDPYDVLGNKRACHYNGSYKHELGWLPDANVRTVTTPGRYRYLVRPLEKPVDDIQLLKIQRGDSDFHFLVEYRQPIGFDSSMAGTPDVNGALIHIRNNKGGNAYVLDMTPNTRYQPGDPMTGVPSNPLGMLTDVALPVGQTFIDPYSQIKITTESANADGLTVKVEIPGSTADTTPPTLSSVAVTNITGSGATVMWTTNEDADSRVKYGTSSPPGTSSPLKSTKEKSHSVTLTGLSANTKYFYQAFSSDAAGNQGQSSIGTFTTTSSGGGGGSAPIVSAGPDQVISTGSAPWVVRLKGSVRDPDTLPAALTIKWEKLSGPSNGTVLFTTPTAPDTEATFSEPGDYVVKLTASDGQSTVSAQARITILSGGPPPPPGNDVLFIELTSPASGSTFIAPATIPLAANAQPISAVTRVEFYQGSSKIGQDTSSPYTFNWTGVGAGTYHLTALGIGGPGSIPLRSTEVVVTVTDSTPTPGAYKVTVTPSAIKVGEQVTLSWEAPANSSSTDQVALYEVGKANADPPYWKNFTDGRTSGQYTFAINQTGTFEGRYFVSGGRSDQTLKATSGQVVVSDGGGGGQNQPPQVSAGPDATIKAPSTITLAGSATDDGKPNGTLTYKWTMVSGPDKVTFSNDTSPTSQVTFPAKLGTYVLKLTVSDGQLQGSAQVTFTAIERSDIEVTKLFLLQAAGEPIIELTNGLLIDLAKLPERLNLRADVRGVASSVHFLGWHVTQFCGPNAVDNYTPFIMMDSRGWTPCTGQQSLTATPYSGLSALGDRGQSLTVNVTFARIPQLTMTASPMEISAGESSLLRWTVDPPTPVCQASSDPAGWTGDRGGRSLPELVSPTVTTTYTLTCPGDGGGSVSRSVTVTVKSVATTP